MKIIDAKNQEVEIRSQHWSLAESLFIKWGHQIEGNEILVIDVNDITSELSAWGIPWKRTI
jgi:hypothetical protein